MAVDAQPAAPATTNFDANLLLLVGKFLASLRLTVFLFALSIFLILVGTLAQYELNMQEVLNQYFCSWICSVRFEVMVPPSFFPGLMEYSFFQYIAPRGIYFPGGATIGLALAINLLAAHAFRFKVYARGRQLLGGIALLIFGVAVTVVVIMIGQGSTGQQDQPMLPWATIWMLFKFLLVVIWLGIAAAFVALPKHRRIEQVVLLVVGLVVGGLACWLFLQDFSLSDSSLRIMWQLFLATLCGLILLPACSLIFGNRGGIVLLHGGVGLLMFGVFWGTYAVEQRMSMEEGETSSFLRDLRSSELVVVDTSDPDHDREVVIPQHLLRDGRTVTHQALPFNIRIEKYVKNAALRDPLPDEDNLATAGVGLTNVAASRRSSSGADTNARVDEPACYATFLDKESGGTIGTYMLSVRMAMNEFPEPVPAGNGDRFDTYLRYRRTYTPYRMTLLDVRKDDYMGTSTPRNYSSTVRLEDPTTGENRDVRIWMNNPLRYGGRTFYQSSYQKVGRTEATELQVVRNAGWRIPYIACMLVAIGLISHFGLTLWKFLQRLQGGRGGRDPETGKPLPPHRQVVMAEPLLPARQEQPWITVAVAAVFLLLGLAVVAMKAAPPASAPDQFDLVAAGQLPVMYEGRVKPLDTLARNTLRIISNRPYFKDAEDEKQPAIRWLMDVIAGTDEADEHMVFRIDDLSVLDTLGLERRKGFRYSVGEMREAGNLSEFERQVDAARSKQADNPESVSHYERRLLETDQRIRTFTLVSAAFVPREMPELPTEQEFMANRPAAEAKMMRFRQQLFGSMQQLVSMNPPLAVPLTRERRREDSPTWEPLSNALSMAVLRRDLLGEDADENTLAWSSMMLSYSQDNVSEFNRDVRKYLARVESSPPREFRPDRNGLEAYLNHLDPFALARVLYIAAFLLTAVSWAFWRKPLNMSAFVLIVLAFGLHTFGLVARMHISGRPPVTNLYSSAVFIGWGMVIFGMAFEWYLRYGIGNVLAAVNGFATLLIAHSLAARGDTLTVLQAVLDTQFWLSTHVVCITFGYCATFVAGAVGICYIVLGVFTRVLRGDRDLYRVMYGTVCFALLLSFVGTVLGGLWADDSWGRFWGWDPKENGALIIVIWNALLLHSRWGGLVRERGFANLAVGGNIVTSWSWFGVNELGIGLHSYGFTDGVLMVLGMFVLSQLVIIAIGLLPRSFWQSYASD